MEVKHVNCVSDLIFLLKSTFLLSFLLVASFIKPCSLKDPQLSDCIVREMENLRPYLPQGVPEMHIPKMEPLRIESAVLESGNDLKVNFINVDLYGLTAFKLISGQFDIKNDFVKVDLFFENLRSEGNYKVKGKLLFFDLNGAGKVNGTLRKFCFLLIKYLFSFPIFLGNTKATAILKGKRQTIKGKEHIVFDKIDMEIHVMDDRAQLYFDNLFENNEELTRATNKAINDNMPEILAEMRPVIRKTVGDIVLSLVGSLFRRYSVDELFPEN